MRLLCTIENEGQGHQFSQFLTRQGIANECEVQSVSDWGSDTYGNHFCRIWVIDEDQAERADDFYQQFVADPDAPLFKESSHILEPLIAATEGAKTAVSDNIEKRALAANAWEAKPLGSITLYLMVLCTLILTWEMYISVPENLAPEVLPIAYLTASPVTRALLYDYPKAYEIVDHLEALYTNDKDQKESETTLSAEAARLLEQYRKTPVWTGIYDKVVLMLKGHADRVHFDVPMFEKLRQGEGWRLFSPILLHSDILHLFFNMIWLLILGKQIESRTGAMRYVLFILVTAAFSNTCQYLMSGPNFLGFSGVLTAMMGFIYVRQKTAAWEGYQLQKVTLGFLAFFILAMLGRQFVSFFAEIYGDMSLAPRIANTAHLSGAALGYLLGKINFFAWRGR